MANERLREALKKRGVSVAGLAEACGVDKKSAERWVTQGRPPYENHRAAAAKLLGFDEVYLWPEAYPDERVAAASHSEIVTVYPRRTMVPKSEWERLFAGAEHDIGILVHAGLFLAEDDGVRQTLAKKAAAGVRVRILLGDPNGEQVARYGVGEGADVAAEIRSALAAYRPLYGVDGIELRLHDTLLYNSIYRADDELLVNLGANGIPAARTPVLRLCKITGGAFANTYLESFDYVWERATPTR
jgi:lambda repressor-like predicted transcriptional regulator